jgi:C-terminal processing protease CtpA/Prc
MTAIRTALVGAVALLAVACASTPPPQPTTTLAPTPTPSPTPTAQPSSSPGPTPTDSPSATQPRTPAGDGPQLVTGSLTYTNPLFTLGVAEPEVILEDQGGFVTRNRDFLIPVQSQVIGQLTSDFNKSPFTYSLTLPARPNGTLNDVNHDGATDTGVQIFAVAYWTNTWGDPYLERRDQGGGGWSNAYASTRVSGDSATLREVYGGKYLVYAPDDSEQFPSGFGPDKKLFTDDDPLLALAAGWSVVDMDQSPFTLDRSEHAVIDLLEPKEAALDDFSSLSYSAAFDRMLDKFSKEYAFTEFKGIDWTAKGAEFRPRFVRAEQTPDPHAYALALRDFINSIPDTHLGIETTLLDQDFADASIGGLGLAMTETDDGRFVVDYLTPGGPAEAAGVQWGADILAVNSRTTADVVESAVALTGPFSNPVVERLHKVAFAVRFPRTAASASLTYRNPDGQEQTKAITLAAEFDSLRHALSTGGSPTDLPVEYHVLPSGLGYIAINSFSDNDVLSIQVYERAIRFFKENQLPGVIVDMRHNGGGSGWLANQMAAYFFSQEIETGYVEHYDPTIGEFYAGPGEKTPMIPPPADLQFAGPVGVLVGQGCASACELFSYDMTINGRADVVGQYPTEGAGGSIERFLMPEGIQVQITTGRALDVNGNIHLEGKGVVPTVKVPVSFATLLSERNGADPILAAAESALAQP